MKSWIDFGRKNCDMRELKLIRNSHDRMSYDFLDEIDLLNRFDDEEIQQYCERMKKARDSIIAAIWAIEDSLEALLPQDN